MHGESIRRHDQKCNDKYQSEDNPDEIEILVVHQEYFGALEAVRVSLTLLFEQCIMLIIVERLNRCASIQTSKTDTSRFLKHTCTHVDTEYGGCPPSLH